MTLRIHAPNPMRVGETANVLVTSDNPGTVSLTYGAGLTGPATVTIEGTREFTLAHELNGDGWECDTAGFGKDLKECTILFEYDTETIPKVIRSLTHYQPVIGSNYGLNRNNWHMTIARGTSGTALIFGVTLTDGTADTQYTTGLIATMGPRRACLKVSGTTLTYLDSLGHSITQTIGTINSVNAAAILRNWCCGEVGYYARLISDGERDTWLLGGARPALSTGDEYWAAAEEGGNIVYAESADANNGVLNQSALYPATRVNRIYTDDPLNPVVPYAIVPVTAVGTTDTTIDATRPRQGVPPRASEAERIETADRCTVTVEAPLVSIGPDTDATVAAYPADVYLQVCATPDGVVSLASDDPNLTVPATVEVSGGSATVTCTASADVTGATITATYGATTDAATVSVTEAPEPAETLVIGPDIDTEVESYPDAIILLLTSNVDGDVEIVSDNENLIPVSPVTVFDGRAEVACLVTADVTGATVTASRDPGPSDSCSVTVSDVLTGDWIACGPNQRTRIEGKRIVWPIRVRSSKDGAFTATADPATGIIIAGPFELASGACDITAQPTQAGTWTLTVEQDGRTDSVTLEALAAAALPAVRQYNLSAEIDAFFDFINRKYGFRPRFTPANVQDVRAEHATDRTYSRYAQGTGQPGSVFGAVALSYQVMISYSSVTMAEQDLGILREEADRYGWNAIGFSMTGQTMFEPVKMMPRLTLTMNFDIIPQGR